MTKYLNGILGEMLAGELCELIDAAANQLRERNADAHEAGAARGEPEVREEPETDGSESRKGDTIMYAPDEQKTPELTPEDLRLLKIAVTCATDEINRRKQPHTELLNQLDELYQKLRNMGA